MQGGKSNEKLPEVKLWGQRQGNKMAIIPIELSSSQEEQNSVYIEKRRPSYSYITRSNRIGEREKNREIEYEIYKGTSQKLLKVDHCLERQTLKESESRNLIAYQIQGGSSTKYVCELYLEERCKKIVAEERYNSSRKDEPKQGKEEGKRALRYFQDEHQQENQNRLIKCFRCGNKGHVSKNCFAELRRRCIYCLGDHLSSDCSSKICFRCNQEGHIAIECHSHTIQCMKCRKNGHTETECGMIIYIGKDYNARFQLQGRCQDDISRLRCMAGCSNPDGHFNCHKYAKASIYKQYEYSTKPKYQQSSQMNFQLFLTDFDGQLAIVKPISHGRENYVYKERQPSRSRSKW